MGEGFVNLLCVYYSIMLIISYELSVIIKSKCFAGVFSQGNLANGG